jgi:hypothetical protein
MARFTESQKKIFTGVAIVEFIIGLALIAVSLAGISAIPILIPLLLLLSAVGLFFTAKRA